MNLADIRKEYSLKELDFEHVEQDPIKQFEKWFQEAVDAEVIEVNAMSLSTVKTTGGATCRIVLLKGIENNSFVFYTNYSSNKGQEIEKDSGVCLNFFWRELERQVRIEGMVEKISAEQSSAYFATRPKGSQMGAWASPQSEVIPNREVLENNKAALEARYADAEQLPRPDHWGGFILKPELIEFWQGRKSRLHDRLQYRLIDGNWLRERLAP